MSVVWPMRSVQRGVSLIEVVTVVAILGLLTATLVPTIQTIREAARELACRNNCRQIGISSSHFVGARGYYHTGGWGWRWVPDAKVHPKYGQPGGWIYQLLPYLEYESTYALPRLAAANRNETELGIHRLLATLVTQFHCPSRPISRVIPFNKSRIPHLANLVAPPNSVALTDYAANGGTRGVVDVSADGPFSSDLQEIDGFAWSNPHQGDGVILLHNRFTPSHMTRGTSNVLWADEKYVGRDNYEFDRMGGNDQSLFSGECRDTRRYVRGGIVPDRHVGGYQNFGTAHPISMVAVRVDGSVESLSINMDMWVFYQMGSRSPL